MSKRCGNFCGTADQSPVCLVGYVGERFLLLITVRRRSVLGTSIDSWRTNLFRPRPFDRKSKKMKKQFPGNDVFVAVFPAAMIVSSALFSAEGETMSLVPPHVPRTGANQVANPGVASVREWTLVRDAVFDETVTRTADGSGSFRLVSPLPESSRVDSKLIPVEGGKSYTFGFYVQSQNGPTYIGAQISLHDEKGTYLRNLISAHGGADEDGVWNEFALPFTVPEGIASIGLQIYKTENTQPGGVVWADDFYLGEGMGLEQPPSPKKPFGGAHVRVDALGNFEVNEAGQWKPFFPLCMFSDNTRDWSVYSKQGWNTIMWTGAAHQVKQAKDAVSDFNPNGMKAGFSISQYTFPSGWAYNNLGDLKRKLGEVFQEGLGDNLLLYYWDNENNHDQWQVPLDVINTIKKLDVDTEGNRLHPIYALQGTYNLARVQAAKGIVDVSGTYFGGSVSDTGGAGQGDSGAFFMLDHLEGQTSPPSFAQFNGVDGAGEMRLRLYHSIILGARAMGYWVDAFNPGQRKEFPKVGPVDEKPWWPDFPNLRREVDRLLPLIREPHWTKWTATTSDSTNVHVGTRTFEGLGYVILVNQTTTPQKVTLTLNGLSYSAGEVRDYFDDSVLTSLEGDSFTVELLGIGIDSGAKVLQIGKAP